MILYIKSNKFYNKLKEIYIHLNKNIGKFNNNIVLILFYLVRNHFIHFYEYPIKTR